MLEKSITWRKKFMLPSWFWWNVSHSLCWIGTNLFSNGFTRTSYRNWDDEEWLMHWCLNTGYNINIIWATSAIMATTKRRKRQKLWTLWTKTSPSASSPSEKPAGCCWFWVRVWWPRNISLSSILNPSADYSNRLLRVLPRTPIVFSELLGRTGSGHSREK